MEPESAPKQLSPGAGCCVALVVVPVVGFIFAMMVGDSTPRGPTADERRAETAVICEDAVKDRLLSPASAKIPWGAVADVHRIGDGRWRMQSHVDAANAFGALLRRQFVCEVEYKGGRASLARLEIQGEPQ